MKAWKLFLLMLGVFVYLFAGTPSLLFLAFLTQFSYLAWFWTAGSFLLAASKRASKLELRIFQLTCLCFLALTLFLAAGMEMILATSHAVGTFLFLTIVPIGIITAIAFQYALYLFIRSLLLAEKAEPFSFFDYFEKYFLLGFFFLGVWWIQPTINRLYLAKTNGS